jgi:hypothetical protein
MSPFETGAFDADVGDDALEPAGQPRRAGPEHAHACGDERHVDEDGVDQDAHGGRPEPAPSGRRAWIARAPR